MGLFDFDDDLSLGDLTDEEEDLNTEALAFLTFERPSVAESVTASQAPQNATEGFIQGIFNDLSDIAKEPIRGLPFALETAGAILGGLGSGGFGAPVGAFAGRLLGETVESFVRDTPLFTGQNAYEVIAAPVFSLPFSTTAGALKAVAKGAKKKLSRIAEPLIDPFITPRNTGELIKKAEEQVLQKRTADYITRNEEILARTVRAGTIQEKSGRFFNAEGLVDDAAGRALKQLEETPRYIPEGLYVVEGDPVNNLLDALTRARDRVAKGKAPGSLRELLPERVPSDKTGTALDDLVLGQRSAPEPSTLLDRVNPLDDLNRQQATRTFDDEAVLAGTDTTGDALAALRAATEEGLGLQGRGVGRATKSVDTAILDDTDYVGKILTRAEEIEKKQSLSELTNFFGIQDEVNRSLERLQKPGVKLQREQAKLTIHRELAERKAILEAQPKITPSVNATYEKQKALIMMGAARDVPGAGPLLREGKQVGLGEDLVAMGRSLTKYKNPEGYLAYHALETGGTYRRQVDEMLNADLAQVFDRWGFRGERFDHLDHVVFNILQDSPELREKALQGVLPVEGFDPEKVKRIAGFIDDVTVSVRDKGLALSRRSALNPADPTQPLPGLLDDPVNRNIFASTSVSGRNVDVITDDIARANKLLAILPADDPMADILKEQLPKLENMLNIAKQSHLGIQRRLSEAADFSQRTGKISKNAFAGAFQESDEKLLMTSDLFGNYQDYIGQLSRKTALDNSMAVVAGTLRRLGDVDLLSKNLAFEQLSKLSPDQIIEQGIQMAPGLVNSLAGDADLKPLMEGLAGIMSRTPEIRLKAEGIIRDQRPLRQTIARSARAVSGQMRQTAITNISDTLRRLPGGIGKNITPDKVSNALSMLNNAVHVLQIGLNPRFLVQNPLQPLMTLVPAVGMDSFSKALMDVATDFDNIAKRAHVAGSIIGDKNLAVEMGITSATGNKFFKAVNFLPETTEKINRVLAHRAGELQAEALGLTGDAAQAHAKQLSVLTNFGIEQVDRPIISSHPMGALLTRYKGYLAGYSTFMSHLLKTDKAAFGDAVVMMTALSGSAGIPMYDFIREIGANLTGEFIPEIPSAIEGGSGALIKRAQAAWPELDALSQLQALDMGQSYAFPWQLANDPAQLFGPVGGPLVNLVTAVGAGDKEKAAQTIQQMGGPLVGRLMQTIGEVVNKGETRTPGGTLIGVRDPIEQVQTSLAFRPSVRQERAQIRRDLEIALQAGDQEAVRDLLKMARAKGLKSVRDLLNQAKSNNKRAENTSALGVLFGL